MPILFQFYFVQKKEPELHKLDKIEFKNTDEPQTIITDKEVKSVSPSKIDAVQKQQKGHATEVSLQDENVVRDEPSVILTNEVASKAVVKKDSISKIVPLVQNKSLKKDSVVTTKAMKVIPKTEVKKKGIFNLKTSPEFIEENPDF